MGNENQKARLRQVLEVIAQADHRKVEYVTMATKVLDEVGPSADDDEETGRYRRFLEMIAGGELRGGMCVVYAKEALSPTPPECEDRFGLLWAEPGGGEGPSEETQ